MRKPAVVVAVDHGRAVVLVDGGQFLEIADHAYRVGQQIEVTVSSRGRRHPLRRAALLAACVTLMVASSGLAVTKYVPWTYVSMDSDAYSVQFTLNARGEVLDARDVQGGEALPFTRFERAEEAERRVFASADTDTEVLIGVADRLGRTSPAANEIRDVGSGSTLEIREMSWQNADKARDADTTLGRFDYVWGHFEPADRTEAETYYRLPFGDLTGRPREEDALPEEADAPSSQNAPADKPAEKTSEPAATREANDAPASAAPKEGTALPAGTAPQKNPADPDTGTRTPTGTAQEGSPAQPQNVPPANPAQNSAPGANPAPNAQQGAPGAQPAPNAPQGNAPGTPEGNPVPQGRP
ncbi:MAG: hypothetical protein IJ174_00710 [Clostridia bacterium]|nr:hypothetical protein [Clostridia bacterium]